MFKNKLCVQGTLVAPSLSILFGILEPEAFLQILKVKNYFKIFINILRKKIPVEYLNNYAM